MRRRHKNDFYETPRKLTKILLKNCPFIKGRIIEPCTGNNAISNYLKEKGYEVYATDITQGDLMDATQADYWENLV